MRTGESSPAPQQAQDTTRSIAVGRLTVLTGIAAASTVIPLPLLPDRVVKQIRGAIAHDVAARNGLTLTTDARSVLADPHHQERAAMRRAAETVIREMFRRMRYVGVASSAMRGLEVYGLGHLFERYIVQVRQGGSIRIQGDEAHHIRMLVDRSIVRLFSPSVSPRVLTLNEPAEDLRDEFTRFLDSVLLTGASMPSYLTRRLDAAFDDIVSQSATEGSAT